jgi:hypothetical protein
VDAIWTTILTWVTHTGIYALNGGLFTLYQLWWNLDKLLTLGVVLLILLYFDPQAQHKATFTPRRYGRDGSATGQGSRTAQAMTAATALLWFIAAFATEPPIPVIGTVMWLAMPQEREGILWRCKSAILIYALAAIGFRLYLWQINSLSPEDWARIVGSTGDVQAMSSRTGGCLPLLPPGFCGCWPRWAISPCWYSVSPSTRWRWSRPCVRRQR